MSVVPPVCTPSANNTVVTTVGPKITDSVCNVWTLSAGAQVVLNGVTQGSTLNVIKLAYVSSTFWQENASLNWFFWNGSGYTAGSNPLPATETLTINTILNQTTASFPVSGTIANVGSAPTLQYQDNSGTWTALPGDSTVTTTAFTFTNPPLPVAATNTVSVRDANTTSITATSNTFAVATAGPSTYRTWYNNPGMDGSYWVTPFASTAAWITSGPLITSLQNGTHASPTGQVNLKGNYAVPWVVGQATDPVVQVTNGTKSINVHIPLGTVIETPTSAFDQSIGGADATQPYLVWTISGATMNTGSVQPTGSVITGTYGLDLDDGSGQMMMDAVTGQPGTNNSFGNLQDYDLSQIVASGANCANYVIPHMLTWTADVSQISTAGPAWPGKVVDTSLPLTGSIPQLVTIGIPASVAKPAGQTCGFYAWFNQLQQFGALEYNDGDGGATTFEIYSTNPANAALVADMVASLNSVMQYVAILNYTAGVTGAQYSLATQKGMAPGGVNAYPAPPPLDLTPTGGHNILPSTFGAWFPSGYNFLPTNSPPAGAPTGPRIIILGSENWAPRVAANDDFPFDIAAVANFR
jgi:hypothetical protein